MTDTTRTSSPTPRRSSTPLARSLGAFAGVVGTASTLVLTAPTSPPALRHGVVSLTTGVRMRYVTQGDTDGIPVILLHGYSDTWYSFSAILPKLSPRVRAFALDQRGHGDTEKPAGGYAMRDLAQDVLAFMDAQAIPRATIVGHSMGTFVAQQVASLAPERVSGIVLLDGAVHVSAFNAIDELDAAVAGLTDPVPLEFTEGFQRSTIHAPVDEAFVARVSEDSRKLPAHAWKAIFKGMMEMEPASGLVGKRIPALLLWGERDAFVPRSAQAGLLDLLPAATLVTLAETGHAPHWERPDRVARELQDFLESLPR